jgi:hypothetical protein
MTMKATMTEVAVVEVEEVVTAAKIVVGPPQPLDKEVWEAPSTRICQHAMMLHLLGL